MIMLSRIQIRVESAAICVAVHAAAGSNGRAHTGRARLRARRYCRGFGQSIFCRRFVPSLNVSETVSETFWGRGRRIRFEGDDGVDTVCSAAASCSELAAGEGEVSMICS